MLANTVFFSFSGMTDPTKHAEYNRWHQMDHRPENLALHGVVHGERWVRSPDCAPLGAVGDARLADVHYVNIYWYRDPAAESIAEWQELAERSFQWGRRPDTSYTARPLMGFFQTVRGYAAPRVLVSPDALPFRPAQGTHVTVLRPIDPHSTATEKHYRWMDAEGLPAALDIDGVAGGWIFSSRSTTLDPSYAALPGTPTTFAPAGSDPGALRVVLLFCDGDPGDVARALGPEPFCGPSGAGGADRVVEVAMASPLRTIEPGRWDWFDRPAG
jgi:hypothetical protein